MSSGGFCSALSSAIACLIGTAFIAEIGYRQYEALLGSFGNHELEEAPLNQYGVVDLRKHKSAALFLYNTTVEEQHHFLHDVKLANGLLEHETLTLAEIQELLASKGGKNEALK